MEFSMKKPKTESEEVELFDTLVKKLSTMDGDFPDYFLEPDIMGQDDGLEEMLGMLNNYYMEKRKMKVMLKQTTNDYWIIGIEKIL